MPPAERLDLEQFFPYRIAVLAARVSRELAEVYRDRGIKPAEWRVLAHLAGSSGVSVREIHRHAHLDKAKVSRAAERLDALGFVRKERDPDDGRLVHLSLTAAGRRLVADIVPDARRFEADLLSTLSDDERAALDRALAKLLVSNA